MKKAVHALLLRTKARNLKKFLAFFVFAFRLAATFLVFLQSEILGRLIYALDSVHCP
jgi:hypothetical protein